MAETGTRATTREKSDGAKKPSRPRRSAKSREVETHVRSFYEAFAARDIDAMLSHWSPDAVEDQIPLAVLRGHGDLGGHFRELLGAMPDLEMKPERIITDDRHAVVEWRMTGTFTGALFQGIEPNGRRLELRGIDVFEIEDKRIVRNTVYYDGSAIPRQLGMLPPQDSGAEKAMKGAYNAVTRLRKAINERRSG